jgi:tetratricopeptide (TPR) repeat protein
LDTSTPSTTTPPTTTLPTKQSALLEIIDLARERAGALVQSLDADARSAIGTVERWAPKDHFAHLATWAAYQARRLDAAVSGATPPQPADNDTVFLERRDEPWETIWADWQRALEENAAGVRRVSDEQLTALTPNGRSLFSLTLNNTYLHPITHLAHLYEERGDVAAAEQVQQEAVPTMARLLGQDEQYANAVYNLGCFYALHGRSAEALAQLREALAVNPQLTDLLKEDVDLVSLHALPAYQALFTA